LPLNDYRLYEKFVVYSEPKISVKTTHKAYWFAILIKRSGETSESETQASEENLEKIIV